MSARGHQGLLLGSGNGGDPFFSYVRSLAHFEGIDGATTTTDQIAGRTWTRENYGTNGVCQISTSQAKAGASSLRHTDRDYQFRTDAAVINSTSGTTPHTLEVWARLDDLSGPIYNRHVLCSQEAGGGSSEQQLMVGYDAANEGKICFYQAASLAGGTALELKGSAVSAAVINTWNHFAFDFDGTAIRLFQNGVLAAKLVRSYGWKMTSNPFRLCQGIVSGYQSFRQGFNGYIDEFRATYGVSRYGSDAGFAVPATPFPDHA